jgi:hypothetical protein
LLSVFEDFPSDDELDEDESDFDEESDLEDEESDFEDDESDEEVDSFSFVLGPALFPVPRLSVL